MPTIIVVGATSRIGNDSTVVLGLDIILQQEKVGYGRNPNNGRIFGFGGKV